MYYFTSLQGSFNLQLNYLITIFIKINCQLNTFLFIKIGHKKVQSSDSCGIVEMNNIFHEIGNFFIHKQTSNLILLS